MIVATASSTYCSSASNDELFAEVFICSLNNVKKRKNLRSSCGVLAKNSLKEAIKLDQLIAQDQKLVLNHSAFDDSRKEKRFLNRSTRPPVAASRFLFV